MFKRYRLREPAGIGLLILLSIFLGVLIADGLLTQRYDNTHTPAYYAEKCLKESGPVVSPEAVAECHEIAKYPQWWDAEDLEAQRQMAVWTRRIGYLTAFGLIVLFWTLWETKAANNAAWTAVKVTENTAAAQIAAAELAADRQLATAQTTEAAILIPEIAKTELLRGNERIRFTVRNVGKTSAVQFGSWLMTGTYQNEREVLLPEQISPPIRLKFREISSGATEDDIIAPSRRNDPGARFQKIYGIIAWVDIFGVIRAVRVEQVCRFSVIGPLGRYWWNEYGNRLLTQEEIRQLHVQSPG